MITPTPVWFANFDLIVQNPNDFQTKLPPPQSPYAMQALIVLVSSVFAYAVFQRNKFVGLMVGLLGAVIAIRYKTSYQRAVNQCIDPIIEGLNRFHLKRVDWIRSNIDMNKSYSQKEVEEEVNRLEENYWAYQWTKVEGKIGDLVGDSVLIDEVNDPYLQSKIYELKRMALKLKYGTSSHFSNHPTPVRPVLNGNRLIRIESWDN